MLCEYGCGREAKYQLKNRKWCCNKSYNSCPKKREQNSLSQKIRYRFPKPEDNPANKKVSCSFCNKKVSFANLKIHERYCYLNPENLTMCPVCQKPIKNYRENATCSNKCARKHFEEMYREFGRNNGGETSYRTKCFDYHERKCVVCKEDKIVTVHHFDLNHRNDSPENLIPICPTHQVYMHSKYKYLIEDKVKEYRDRFVEAQVQILPPRPIT